MYLRFSLLCILIVSFQLFANASTQRPIGTWKSFFPYSVTTQVEESEDRIYCASSLGIFYIEKEDNSMHTLDKTTGLSDVGIKRIKYSSASKTLVIVYQNSNIDLLKNGNSIYNIPEIKNKITTSSKNINNITVSGSLAYLSSDLGISVLDLERNEIKSTYVIGNSGGSVVVNDLTINQGKIYAATDEGVKVASLNSSNLQDYNNWVLQAVNMSVSPSNFVNAFNGNVYAVSRDTVWKFDGNSWTNFYSQSSWNIKQLKVTGDKLWIALWIDTANVFLSKWATVDNANNIAEVIFQSSIRPLDISYDGKYWVADFWSGLMRYDNVSAKHESFIPNGPFSNGVFNMAIHEDILYLAAGGTDEAYITPNNNRDGIQVFKENFWRAYNSFTGYGELFKMTDNLSVAVNDVTYKVYWASYTGGLTEYNIYTDEVKVYDQTNSPLETVFGSTVAVSALTYDDKGNIWMMNSGTPKQLKVLKFDGTWLSFSLPYSVPSTRKMVFDRNGLLWMCQRGGDIIVYDPGDDIDSPADDQFKRLGFGVGNGNLPNNGVWAIVEDKLGDIWVGTEEGIGTFYCSGSVFSTRGCDADRIKVERDGFIGYLFSTEIVRAIAVDGGNRKWVGTTNGLYLIAADGKTEIHRFTKDNSPLPANYITDIKINPNNGEVFIGTELGLVSYQGDATEGGEKKGEVLVYPNPVRPDYYGPIAIKGLVDEASVKITDAAGTLVYQGKAFGGQMIWNGRGYNGDRAKSGVYIVYAANDTGKERSVAKIVLIN
jgi:ligand-binding sensor domain-containing protein